MTLLRIHTEAAMIIIFLLIRGLDYCTADCISVQEYAPAKLVVFTKNPGVP